MKKLFTFIILSQLCFTSLSYVQDIIDDLEFTENKIYTNFIIDYLPSPSPSPSLSFSPSPSPSFKIYHFHNNLIME